MNRNGIGNNPLPLAWRPLRSLPRTLLHGVAGSREIGILGVAILLFLFFAAFAPHFLDRQNLLGALRQMTLLVIVAVGMTYLFIAGELDISVGANFGLATIVLSLLIAQYGWNPFLAAGATLGLGAAIGLFNGIGVTRTGIPSLIFTLGMLNILSGLGLMLTGGFPINFEQQSLFTQVTGGFIGSFSVQVIWAAVIVAIGAWVLAKTRFGYHVYATGGNKISAQRAGIATNRVKVTCFVLTGILSSLVGVLLVGLVQSGNPGTGNGFELQVIGAVVVGGVNLFGGAGSVLGAVIGAAILSIIGDGLILMGVSVFAEQLVEGLIIIVAVFIDIRLRQFTVRR